MNRQFEQSLACWDGLDWRGLCRSRLSPFALFGGLWVARYVALAATGGVLIALGCDLYRWGMFSYSLVSCPLTLMLAVAWARGARMSWKASASWTVLAGGVSAWVLLACLLETVRFVHGSLTPPLFVG